MQPNVQSKPQKEGSESEQFWDLLGGKSEYSSQKIGRDAERDSHLFSCTLSNGMLCPYNVNFLFNVFSSTIKIMKWLTFFRFCCCCLLICRKSQGNSVIYTFSFACHLLFFFSFSLYNFCRRCCRWQRYTISPKMIWWLKMYSYWILTQRYLFGLDNKLIRRIKCKP